MKQQEAFELILLKPTLELEQQAAELYRHVDETDLDESSRFAGFGQLNLYQGKYAEWVALCADIARGIDLPQGYAPATTMFAVAQILGQCGKIIFPKSS